MKKRVRVITGAVLGSALALGTALPAAAGTGTATTEGWTMKVSVPNYTWNKTSGCEEIPVQVDTDGWGADWWMLDADVRHAQSGADSDWLFDYGAKELPDTVDNYYWTSSIQLCDSDVPGTYVLDGTADYGFDFDYTIDGKPGAVSAPITTTFTLSKMSSTTTLNPVASNGTTAKVTGRVVGNSAKHGKVGIAEKVSVQRYVNGAWQQVGTVNANALGNFSITVSGATAAVPYRAVFAGTNKVAGSTSASVTATLPKPTVSATAVSKKSKLKVDVNPDKGKGYWTFQVQKKAGNTWVPLKTYKTVGSKETKTVNLPKGTYRVKVNAKYGYASTYSAPVTLVK